MYIDDCTDCKIITGPIDSSIFIRTCKNLTVSTIARQVRFRDSEDIKIFAYCPSDPAVESSFNIAFAPYNAFFPYLKQLFLKGKFQQSEPNHIKTPYDFTGEKVYRNGARHFFQMPEDEFYIDEVNDGEEPCEEMFEGYSQQEPFISRKLSRPENGNQKNEEFNMEPDNNQNIQLSENNNHQSYGDQVMGNEGFEFSSNVPLSIPIDREDVFDSEEQNRQIQRQKEIEEREKKIREKIDLELKMKNQLREKAMEYIINFNSAHIKKTEDNKKNNAFNEAQRLNEKEELGAFEGSKINPWERVCKMVDLKESNYKGSKNVSRMRECFINRKGDFNQVNPPK